MNLDDFNPCGNTPQDIELNDQICSAMQDYKRGKRIVPNLVAVHILWLVKEHLTKLESLARAGSP
jgi:hypothetical protein